MRSFKDEILASLSKESAKPGVKHNVTVSLKTDLFTDFCTIARGTNAKITWIVRSFLESHQEEVRDIALAVTKALPPERLKPRGRPPTMKDFKKFAKLKKAEK